MNAFPNILVISQTIPQTVYAGCILLYRLLENYPPENLLVIGSAPHPDAKLLKCRYETLTLPLQRLDRTRFCRLVRSLRTFGLFPQFTLRSIHSRLKNFKPDLVISLMQVQPYYQLACRYAKINKLPLLLIIHDLAENFEITYKWAEKQQLANDCAAYQYASKRLCISPEMRDYLEKTYGYKGDVLYPNRDEHLTPRPLVESRTLKQPGTLTIGYAGSLAYGYGIQLNNLLPALRETRTKLRVYSNLGAGDRRAGDDDSDAIAYCGFAASPHQTWSRLKKECDALILPYCWSDDLRQQNLYRTHFPSKLPEYLALGMPVIIMGPEYATGVKWGLQNPDAALVVTENNRAAWVKAFTQLKESVSRRETLSQRAIIAGDRDFDPVTIRSKFLQHVRETVQKTGESPC